MSASRVCQFRGCRREIGPRHIMCFPHWRLVPLLVRSQVVGAQRRCARGTVSPLAVRALRVVAVRYAETVAAKGGAR